MEKFSKAEAILNEFKGDSYLHGLGVMPQVGQMAACLGKKAVLIADCYPGSDHYIQQIKDSLSSAGVSLVGEVAGAAPNCPREDLFRIADSLKGSDPDVLVSFGGGSTIDAVKSAEVLRTLGGSIDDYFGTGQVSKALQSTGKTLAGHVAIQTAASSAAHLTRYSNITDISTGQKKLIVDGAITPQRPVFDYEVTFSAPRSLTSDGAVDGISHALEVLYSTVGKPEYGKVEVAAMEAIWLVVNYLPRVIAEAGDVEARHALGLATDLGGYCIMLGGTNGAHLTSFSLVEILSHGRACGMLNPYYTVFFAPAIQQPLMVVGKIYQDAGFTSGDISHLSGRALGLAVAEAMFNFERKIGIPTTLSEVAGFNDEYIRRALSAAKDPQLKMKLENMPVALTADMIDEYMGPILTAAKTGDLNVIQNV